MVLCAASLDVENELKEIRTILARQEREIQGLKSENRVLRSKNRVFRSENRGLRADVLRIATEIETLKNDNFHRTEIAREFSSSQNEVLRERNTSGVLKSSIRNTEAMKQSKMERLPTRQISSGWVAFYAYMSNNEHNPSIHHAIIFDQIQTNIGDGYNKYSGVVHAPSSGVYFFTWTIYSGGSGETKVVLFVNDSIMGFTYSDTKSTGSYDSDSAFVVVHLNAHDNVYLRAGFDCSTSLISNPFSGKTTFAGGKLFF